jgi:hypothetical protein
MTRDETIQGRHGLQLRKAGVGKHLTHSIRLQKPMQLFSEEDLSFKFMGKIIFSSYVFILFKFSH